MNKMCRLFAMVLVLSANPIMIEVINEFQVAPYDSERVELRYLQSAAGDTIFTETFDLYNTEVVTPAGVAYVDTNILLAGMGQTVIDRSALTGVFELPEDTGYVMILGVESLGDSIFYPGHATTWCCAPAPPYYCSAAKFHCYAYIWDDYYLISDWYIDSTPTFGAPNDDYPGCLVSGYVYDNYSQPIFGARVTATFFDLPSVIFPPLPYQVCCTTFTASNGSYYFDSLLPYDYYVDVNVNGYLPDTQYTGGLCCTDPITNLDFYLQTGITEDQEWGIVAGPFVRPNPFHSVLHIT
ncbi:MAG: carboxypeptidase-like regulatory domain-containing protein, partial [bacterium]